MSGRRARFSHHVWVVCEESMLHPGRFLVAEDQPSLHGLELVVLEERACWATSLVFQNQMISMEAYQVKTTLVHI